MLFIQLVLICFFGSTPTIRACAEWTIISPPIIFGETARLGCEIQNGTDGDTRTWQGGPGFTTIYFNGVSSNPQKYMEVTAREPYRSLLEIYKFSENDVDCDYSCSIGFQEDRHTLSLNPEDFELHPTKDSKVVAANLLNGHLLVEFSLMKVYPEPKFSIQFQGRYYNGTRESRRDGKFFREKIRLDHTFKTLVCKGQLIISCIVGKTDIELYSLYFNTCPVIPAEKNTSNGNSAEKDTSNVIPAEKNTSNGINDFLPITITVCVFVVVLLLVIGIFYRRKSSKGPAFCDYCNTCNWNSGDAVAVDHLNQKGEKLDLLVQSSSVSTRANNDDTSEEDNAKTDGKGDVQSRHIVDLVTNKKEILVHGEVYKGPVFHKK